MSATDRQNRLLIAEDWKRIYQSFRNADFQSYDFDNLRRVMINYLRENYPEDFNDYIESSEYLALIDLIAFLGQSVSYRIDLNARDNFLELAERRESVLRLARLLSYNPKRNIAGSGLLKFSAVSTTQTVYDSNGRNLSNTTVAWNDSANANWYDQFIKIVNAALPATRQFGNPDDKADIQGITTEQYRFQAANTDVPVYAFTKSVDGRSMDFEVVSTTFRDSDEIYEEPPQQGNRLSFVYRSDNRGNGSPNSGFFVHFKQGNLNQGQFSINQPSTSETVDIDTVNINNSDVWLYRLDSNNLESELWTQVPSLEGNNIIYNSLQKNIKNIYGVLTQTDDRVSLIFSDGTFGTLPRGTFKAYYRTSNGISYTINPKDIRNVSINIPYVSNVGQIETLTITLSLASSVTNASSAETSENIKKRAPATYYTQNRMVTAEDYNISPLSVSQEVVKIKAINRTSSGISRYFDLRDPTGKYSEVNLFADDGALYEEYFKDSFRFKYSSKTDIEGIVYNQVVDKLQMPGLRNFYYSNYDSKIVNDSMWVLKTTDTNLSTGYIGNVDTENPLAVGSTVENNLKYFKTGALVKFTAPVLTINNTTIYTYFDKSNNNELVKTVTDPADIDFIPNATTTLWCKVISVTGNATGTVAPGEIEDDVGTISLNDIIPNEALLTEIVPVWNTSLDKDTVTKIVGLVFANKQFGLRYDQEASKWVIITGVNLDVYGDFSLKNAGNTLGQQKDASWLVSFTTDTEYYTVNTRSKRYVFESDTQMRFYYNSADNIYDSKTQTNMKDKIKVLSVNTRPNDIIPFTFDREWEISKEFIGIDGYVDTKKIEVTFNDGDNDGVVDNPDIFNDLVSSTYVILERYDVFQGQQDYRVFDNKDDSLLIVESELNLTHTVDSNNANVIQVNNVNYYVGQYFYFEDTQLVKRFTSTYPSNTLEITTDYKVYTGRDKLKFQYTHVADSNSRIDPGITNIVDIFILTKQYDRTYRQWLNGSITEEPLPLSSDSLHSMLSGSLNKIKTISDEVVYHPVKYKLLFGNNADEELRATFKVVKNPNSVLSDNDVKTKVLSAINEFFNLENWDFGDNFYFTELATFVTNRMSPDIVNFLIVPRKTDLMFGNLFEIKAERDQIFVNGATVNDIEIISSITASNIKSSGNVTTKFNSNTTQQINSSGN